MERELKIHVLKNKWKDFIQNKTNKWKYINQSKTNIIITNY